jgi:hypothetical protein
MFRSGLTVTGLARVYRMLILLYFLVGGTPELRMAYRSEPAQRTLHYTATSPTIPCHVRV